MVFRNIIFIVSLLLSVFAYGETVDKIIIQGNERIEDDTIKSYLNVQPGVNFNSEDLDRSIKKLYASNMFKKVEISVKGNSLIVKVIENPKINLIVFEGNSKLKSKDLEAEIILKPRAVYTKAKVQEDVNRIIDLYHKNGRFSAKVIPQIIVLPHNRVNLVYRIEEGPVAKIEKIIFVGNNEYSDYRLRTELSSKETHWYYFLSSSDLFNPARLEYDRELLTRFYQSRGYADFKIISIITNVSEKKERFYITITVDEGERYDFGKIDIKSELKDKDINLNDLKSEITTKEKDTYDVRKVEKSVDLLIKRINDQGYAFVDVDPQVWLDQEKRLVNITYFIGESKRVYIDKINIKGNVRTADKVIRREFRLAEGDPYNATKITRSEQRINNLDFFEKANIETVRTSEPDKVDLNLKLQEKSTASLNFAGGYSTTDGPLARIGFSEPNLLGNGQQLDLAFMKAENRFNADMSFTEPYLFDMPLSGGFDIFNSTVGKDTSHYRSYDNQSEGIKFRLGYNLTEYLSHQFYYRFSHNKISNVSDDASDQIKDQVGERNTSTIGQSIFYNRLDSNTNPTDGYFISLSQDFAGLGGSTKFLRHTIKSRYYHPIINDDVILILGAEGGMIDGLDGQEVRINDRFFLGGGSSLRGFNYAGVGPRDKEDNNSLGGNRYYSGTSEVRFPLGFGKEMGLFGAAFVDVGNLYKVDVDNRDEIWDSSSLRSSYGVGIGFTSPMGPIRIHYSVPMSKESYDRKKKFDITFSTAF